MRPGSPLRWHLLPPPGRPEGHDRTPKRITTITTFGVTVTEHNNDEEQERDDED